MIVMKKFKKWLNIRMIMKYNRALGSARGELYYLLSNLLKENKSAMIKDGKFN